MDYEVGSGVEAGDGASTTASRTDAPSLDAIETALADIADRLERLLADVRNPDPS